MKKIFFIAAVFAALCLPSLFASDPVELKPFTVSSTKSYGMGGPHVAYTDDVFSLFVNPAALMRSNQRSFFEIGVGAYGPIIELFDIVNKVQGGDDNALVNQIGDFAKNSGGKIPLGAEIRGPLSIGYTANGLGFGLWNRLNVDSKILGTDIVADFSADMILNYGMGFNIFTFGSHTLDTGFTAKVVARAALVKPLDESILSFINSDKISSLTDDLSVPLIMGGGLDFGFTYRWNDLLPGNTLIGALAITDLPTFVGASSAIYGGSGSIPSYVIYPRVNIGVAYTADFREFSPVPLDMAFMMDYYDIARWFVPYDFTKRNPILNWSFGLEATFFKMISLRAGLNDMLPSVGLGFNFGGFKIEGAMYGKELGVEPGQLSTYAFDLSISVRPGSKQRVWPWTKASIVDAVGGLLGNH